jgi:hypothetical protein
MDTKQPLTLFVVAILAASVFSVVGITSIPLQKASAQTVTIETSADELGGTFFGHGVLQVIIEDDSTDDDAPSEFINVDVEGDGSSTASCNDAVIPDTNDGSQRFEFFLVHEDSTFATGTGIDAINVDGTQNSATGTCDFDATGPGSLGAPIITWGSSAAADITTGDDLFDDVTFTIDYGNEDVTINYEEVPGDLTLDRDLFGSTSLIYFRINDQDANLNPTDADAFTLTEAQVNTLLFDIEGGAFDEVGGDDITFEETGDNTAVFEAEIFLDQAATTDQFDATEDTVQLTLNDQADYDTTLLDSAGGAIDIEDGGINDSTDTSEFSFEISDEDGSIDDIPDLTFSGELKMTLRDDDQNIDSEDEDVIVGAITIDVDAAGGDSLTIDMEETGENTGVFMPKLSNDEVKITFLSDGVAPDLLDDELQLRATDIDEDIVIEYTDPLPDTTNPVASFTVQMITTPVSMAAPEEVGVTDEFTVTITDSDLNDNSKTRDSYTIELDGVGPYPLMRGGLEFGDQYEFETELNGDALDFVTPTSITLRETGINTGIFEAEFDMQDISDNAEVGGDPVELSDGDDLKITASDFMADVADADEDSVTITIGKASVGVDFSRTTVPIPPEDGSATQAEVGDAMVTTLQLTDPALATQSNVEELVDFEFGTGDNQWVIDVEGDDVNTLTIESNDDFFGTDAGVDCDDDASEARIVSGISLCEVMGIDSDADLANFLDETGKATGVFEAELEFTSPVGMDAGDWQDAEITFTYTTDEGDEESAGVTFRGNDAIISVDQPTAKTGTIITISVEDQDLNLDDGDTEAFDAQGDLLLIETDDEDIQDLCPTATISDETFEETGDDTGVFSAEFEVGSDIPVTCLDGDTVESAGTILVTYDDEIDSTGGSGDELEFNIALATATGGIQVSPTLVGPATEITILITDLDLDEDSDSTDDYKTPDGSSDDFFVSFSSSRNEVDEGSPDIEETGPNTGVFMWTLELITDEQGCQDDDLDGDKFKATGGDTDATIGACPGDLIAIKYDDEHTANGGSATVSEIVEVKSFDPEFKADKDSYTVGDRVTISISDPDANRKSDIADSLTDIRVTSDSDKVGESFSAIETGRDTGVFKLSFGTATGSQSGSISVKNGDDITVKYTDDFPADFEEQEEDKDFEFSVPVGAGPGGKAAVSPPEPQDVTGKKLTQINAGQQVVLTTNVVNQGANSQPFVALVEVRDSSDVTVYLAWQTGTLNPNGQTNVGLSWTPDQAGNYQVRTFVISSLAKPDILSAVASTPITVS